MEGGTGVFTALQGGEREMKLEDILAICRKIHEPLRLRGLQSAKFNKENVCKGILKQSYLCM